MRNEFPDFFREKLLCCRSRRHIRLRIYKEYYATSLIPLHRCLNRRHVQLLDRLHAQCVEALRRSLVADKALSTEVAVELLKQAQFGFRYPSEFSVISLHGLCPPFEPNLGIFAPPHWMSFKAVREVVGKSGKITDVSACLPSSSVVGSLPKALVEAQDIGTRLVKGSNS